MNGPRICEEEMLRLGWMTPDKRPCLVVGYPEEELSDGKGFTATHPWPERRLFNRAVGIPVKGSPGSLWIAIHYHRTNGQPWDCWRSSVPYTHAAVYLAHMGFPSRDAAWTVVEMEPEEEHPHDWLKQWNRDHGGSPVTRRKPDAESFVYFIQAKDGGPIKIGKAADPKKRLKGLQTGTHKRLTILAVVPGGHSVEHGLHYRFSEHRIKGEWFKPAPEIIEYLKSLL